MSRSVFGEIHIYIADPDEDDVDFADSDGMPILQWSDRDCFERGMSGWRVSFEEFYGNGVCTEFTTGLREDQVESAVEWARREVESERELAEENL